VADPERRPRIVIADDDDRFADALATLIEADGRVEVIGIASNGDEAVQLSVWQDPDVVLMDAVMPGIDGVEATRLVRVGKPRICILMVSGDESEELQERAREAGAAGFLHKSRFASEILDVILELAAHQEHEPRGN